MVTPYEYQHTEIIKGFPDELNQEYYEKAKKWNSILIDIIKPKIIICTSFGSYKMIKELIGYSKEYSRYEYKYAKGTIEILGLRRRSSSIICQDKVVRKISDIL